MKYDYHRERTLAKKLASDLESRGYKILDKFKRELFYCRRSDKRQGCVRIPCDIVAQKGYGCLIVEVKLSTANIHHGVGQLLWYRHLIGLVDDNDVRVTELIFAAPGSLTRLQQTFLDKFGIQFEDLTRFEEDV